ncbi:hypothetical protein Vca1114GL_00935 [Vibrio campbellii]|nr:hypothetical protein Vca1114GL_00935 [Vibrio campbellii]
MDPNDISFKNEVNRNISLVSNINWTITNRRTLNFSFSGYENGKSIIRPLAKGSCAYCGDKIRQHTLVVEHYRPKNRLKARDNEFVLTNGEFLETNRSRILSYYGYFIWGSDYRNLLPACRPCNTGEGSNAGVYINNTLKYSVKYGKDDYFPILRSKETREGIYVESIKNEYPLLFNPYKDNPNELFSYKIPLNLISRNNAIEIRPNKRASKRKRLKAEMSINILGLNRQSLCNNRWDIFDGAARVSLNLAEDLKSSTVTLSKCVNYAKTLCKLNSDSHGTMHGFTMIYTKKPVKFLYKVIVQNFPVESGSVFKNANSFSGRIDDLEKFIDKYEPICFRKDTAKLNGIMDSYLR